MQKPHAPLFTISFLLLSALFFSDVQAQAKKIPQTVSAGIVNGKALSLPKPEYPAEARKSRVAGAVHVQVVIDEAGNVVSAKAVSGIENPSLRKAAEEAALRAKFSPTLLSGKAVKVTGVIVYNFVDNASNEERVKIFAVSTFLSILRNSAADPDKFNNLFAAQDFIQESIEEFSDFSVELSPLASIVKLTPDARRAKIDQVISAVRGKLNGSGLWQFELGENFGEILSQLAAAGNEENADISKFDEEKVKKSLLRIKELCLGAPSDFPADVLSKLNEFADFHNKNQIISAENLEDFFDRMKALIESISPGATR